MYFISFLYNLFPTELETIQYRNSLNLLINVTFLSVKDILTTKHSHISRGSITLHRSDFKFTKSITWVKFCFLLVVIDYQYSKQHWCFDVKFTQTSCQGRFYFTSNVNYFSQKRIKNIVIIFTLVFH